MSAGGTIPGPQQQNPQPQNPSLPPADYSMGYARNFQPPSFFNPFSGYYGANTGMGGFQSQFGGFQQPQFGGFGGGFQQPQFGGFGGFGGFQQPQYGGFQQPQYGGFQQPFGGGFSQPSFGNPFSRGFNPRTMPPPYTPPQPPQPQPQPMPIGGGAYQPGVGNQRIEMGSGMGGFGGFDPMMGGLGGFGRFGGFQQQRDPNQPPPGMKLNPTYDAGYAMALDMPMPGSEQALRKQRFIPV
jgi:hypothetical protein